MSPESHALGPDEAIMAAYLAGDPRAFDALFRGYSPTLLRLFRRRGFQLADCHDLVQQTFLQLHRARGAFRPGERLRPWLFTIARNAACDHVRRVMRRAEQACDVDRRPSPLGTREPATIDAALARLSGADRRLIDEHFGQDRSFGELGSRDGVSPGTLRVRAYRARARLRAMLEERAP